MRLVNIDEIYELALNAKEEIWNQAQSLGRDVKIYLHWTAGRYTQAFDDYHICITGDGRIFASTDDFSSILSHTWKRNTGAIGISLCCCYEATTNDLGEFPPTAAQIETMAQVIATVANALDLTIDINHVMTHSEAADCMDGNYPHEPYGYFSTCERWDLLFLGTPESPSAVTSYYDPASGGAVLRGKANFYRNKWRGES